MASRTDSTEILAKAREGAEAAVASRVFGAPIERDGVTVVPVAVISGGGGGGSGSGTMPRKNEEDNAEGVPDGEGSGGGFGFSARPAGVYVIKDGNVSWRPAVNVNAIVAGGQLVLAVAFLVARSIWKNRH